MRHHVGLPNGLDLENVIEEIEDVGNSQLFTIQSYLRLILLHAVKIVSSGSADPHRHWRAEIANSHADLVSRYSRSMRRAIDMDLIGRRALAQAAAQLDVNRETVAAGMPAACPVELDAIVAEIIEADRIIEAIRSALDRTA